MHVISMFANRRIAAALAATVLLAACSAGAGTGSQAANAGGANPAASDSAGAGASAGAVAGGAAACGNPEGASIAAVGGSFAAIIGSAVCGMQDLDPCSMLDAAAVQALFAVPLAAHTTNHTGDCTWPLSDPSLGDGMDVVVNVGPGSEQALDDDIDVNGATPVSGVGDHAGFELLGGYFPHLGAVKGTDTCEIIIGGGNAQLAVAQTGKGVFAAIDKAALPGLTTKIGGLCNAIFTAIGA